MPTNLASTGINLAFASSCVCALLAAAEALAALMHDQWFSYSASSSNSISLWNTCTGSNCTDWVFTDVNRGVCTLSGTEIQGRIFTLRGLLIAGPTLLILFALLVLVGRCCDSLSTIMGAILCAVVAAFCFVTEVALFYDTTVSYIFCGMAPDAYYSAIGSTATVFYMYGGPFGLCWCAAATSVLAALIGGTAMYRMRAPERLPKLHGLVAPKSRPGTSSAAAESSNNVSNGKITTAAIPSPVMSNRHRENVRSPSAGGGRGSSVNQLRQQQQQSFPPLESWRMEAEDFALDEESGYFWSEDAQVYWSREQNMFFDPRISMWWDPIDLRWDA